MNIVTGPPRIIADTAQPSDGTLGQIGALRVRLARSTDEIEAAQALRFEVFANEYGAELKGTTGRDVDRFDAICDHLIVIDTELPGSDRQRIVGTYRLLPQDRLGPNDGFYSNASFELDRLMARHHERRFVEMGRSCVLPAYRGKRTIELLWQGIWAYCRQNGHDVMIGCASFSGIDPAPHNQALAFLHHHAAAEGAWAVKARGQDAIPMDTVPAEDIDLKAAMRALPPLIKGYLRLGARFATQAMPDPAFSSIDVLVILPVEQISPRYLTHYGVDAQRFAV